MWCVNSLGALSAAAGLILCVLAQSSLAVWSSSTTTSWCTHLVYIVMEKESNLQFLHIRRYLKSA